MKLYFSVLFLLVSSFGYAGNIDDALSFYAKRGEGIVDVQNGTLVSGVFQSSKPEKAKLVSNANKAFVGFEEALNNKKTASDADLAKALDGIGRSAYFLGVLAGDLSSNKKKEDYFKRCRSSASNHLLNAKVVTVAQSVRLICTAYWFKTMKVNSPFKALIQLPKLKSVFNDFIANDLKVRDQQLKIDLKYLGGGVERTVAGIFSNKTAASFNGKLKDRKVAFVNAINQVENALARGVLSNSLLPALAKHSGLDYYGNHRVHADLYVQLSKEGDRLAGQILTHYDDQDDYDSIEEKAEELIEEYVEEITDRLESTSNPVPSDMIVDAVLERRLIQGLKESL